MLEALGPILPLAAGVAISPLPIVAVILILFSARARSNGTAFLVGWVAGLVVVAGVVLLVLQPQDHTEQSARDTNALLQLALGLVLLAVAFRRWRSRPTSAEEATPPRWMGRLDELRPPRALGLAALLSGVNPKNAALTIAAAASVAQAEVSTGTAVAAMAVYVALASVTIAVPVVLYAAAPDRARPVLDRWRGGLVEHNAVVMAVVFTVFGLLLLGKGIAGLG